MNLGDYRIKYSDQGWDGNDLGEHPMDGVIKWFQEADQHEKIIEPNAVILSTTENKKSFQRTVLAKNIDRQGVTIFTNYQSQKGQQIEANPQVSILFPWHAMERQIFIQATVTRSSTEVSDNYFYSRPYESQAGAWASNQSEKLENRQQLVEQYETICKKYPKKPSQDNDSANTNTKIPRPKWWGGYQLTPTLIEFWQGGAGRLHDRLVFEKQEDLSWTKKRLSP